MRLFKTRTQGPKAPAGYLCSETDLYWVEHTRGERVVIEDCRTGTLIDVPIAFLARLRPVARNQAGTA